MTLFSRSLLLIASLVLVSAAATFQLYRVSEREPRARELAQQTVSIVNLVRAALVNANPVLRRDLLIEINEREGIRLAPLTGSEVLEPLPADPVLDLVKSKVRASLGRETRFAYARDQVEGFWVSFHIEEDDYWVMLPRERFEPGLAGTLLVGGLALLALALAGAWLIASMLSRPLGKVAEAARAVGQGQAPVPLEEAGPRELRTVAVAFNRMAGDLAAMERERAMVLAGISHDLRTPLARLRLAVEMSGTDKDTLAGIAADVEEMDKVIGQFLDFARGQDESRAVQDLGALAADLADSYRRRGFDVVARPGEPVIATVAPKTLRRAVANLVDNALRHAGGRVEIEVRKEGALLQVDVLDRGPGIPSGEAERLKRPFTRRDESRSGAGGAGLGLAIVERIAQMHGGSLQLLPRDGGGLLARLELAA